MYARTPYAVDYVGEYGRNTGLDMLRWVGTTGEKGPWRETSGATVGVS